MRAGGSLGARDRAVLDELVEKLGVRIGWVVRPCAADEDHVKDLMSDCWVAILERLDQYRGLGSFDSWALAVSENVCRMRLREAKRRPETALEDATSVLDYAPDPRSGYPTPRARDWIGEAGIGSWPRIRRDPTVRWLPAFLWTPKGTSGSQTDSTPTEASGAVFDPGGRWLGTLEVPLAQVTWSGEGLVMGVNHDPDTGVETVEAYRLSR